MAAATREGTAAVAGVITREEAARLGLRALVRTASGFHFHGPADSPPEGEFITYIIPEAARRICDELDRIYWHRQCPRCSASDPGPHRRRGSVSHFGCGHPKTGENTYGSGGRARCRACALRQSGAWNRANRGRRRELDREYRRGSGPRIARSRAKHRLAYQIYFHLRKLAIKDGLWPVRPRASSKEGGTP